MHMEGGGFHDPDHRGNLVSHATVLIYIRFRSFFFDLIFIYFVD